MTPEKLRKIAPEFAAKDDDTLAFYLDLAQERLDARAWGKPFSTAVCLLTAHLATTLLAESEGAAAGTGAAGQVTQVTVGRWSMQFGKGLSGAESGLDPAADGSLVQTRYGREFLALRKTRAAGRSRLVSPYYT